MPGKQVCPERSPATCLGMSCLQAEVDHGLGDFLHCQTWGTGAICTFLPNQESPGVSYTRKSVLGVSEHRSTKGGETSLSPISCHSGLSWEAAYGAPWKNKLRNVFLACWEGTALAAPDLRVAQGCARHSRGSQAAGRAGVQELG